jgi:protein SCO1/2
MDLYELGRKNRGLSFQQGEESWHYVTSNPESIAKVTEALGFRYTYNEATGLINHPAGIMVLTPEGKVSSYIYGQDYPTRVLEDDIKVAAQNKIGREAEVVLLGCVRVDSVTGQRTLVIEGVLRLFCIATVISIVASILVMNKKYKAGLPGQAPTPGQGGQAS